MVWYKQLVIQTESDLAVQGITIIVYKAIKPWTGMHVPFKCIAIKTKILLYIAHYVIFQTDVDLFDVLQCNNYTIKNQPFIDDCTDRSRQKIREY